jgi:hypothetical protein
MMESLGRPRQQERVYAEPERLADVMALIQVLALDEHTHRSEEDLKDELQGPPRSADQWESVAQAHPEFIRVNPGRVHRISLIARHVSTNRQGDHTEPLAADFVGNLLRSAVDIHDRQVRRRER